MPNASGVFKQLAYKLESTYGSAPGQASGQSLRRVQSTVDLGKDTYESAEIRADLQRQDFRHGVRRVAGQISGELSPGTWKDFYNVILKRDFAALTAVTGLSLTIAGSGPTYTVTRSAGSFLTDGFKKGMVVRLSVGSLNAANITKNLFIVDIGSATVLTVMPLNGVALVAEGPIATCTVTATGKVNWIPTTGHTDKSIAVEHWYSDISQSELFLGLKPNQCSLQLPPTGIATIAWDMMGQDFADVTSKRTSVALTSQYFTSPTAATTTGLLAAVNGLIRLGGSTLGVITGASIDFSMAMSADPVVGQNYVPEIFLGKSDVKGQLTAFFEDLTLLNYFKNETEVELLFYLTASSSSAADAMTIYMPRCKLGGATVDTSGEAGQSITMPFQALKYATAGSGIEATTIRFTDTAA